MLMTDRIGNSRICLNLQMVIDSMEALGWECSAHRAGDTPSLTGCLLYHGQKELYKDQLYLVPEGSEADFPANTYSYVTNGTMRGDAPYIRVYRQNFAQILNHVISVFTKYRDFERDLNNVINSGGSLAELCKVGSAFLHNPMYIHDSLFAVIAESDHIKGMIDFEYNEKTRKMYVPLWMIDEFKFDEVYRQTLTLHHASVWRNDQYTNNIRSLFVNLWNGEAYMGRLIINELTSSLQPGQFRVAEYFAEFVILWMHNHEIREQHRNYNFEETFIDLITTGDADERDLQTIMGILDWNESDNYLCISLRDQNTGNSVRSDSVLNSRLSSMLTGAVTFHYQQQLCIVVNLRVSKQDPLSLRLQLAPLIRDSCMYAGISNPVEGIRALRGGYIQSELAMDYILYIDNSDWMVSFASCALSYIRESACKKLPAKMVAHPVLMELQEHDKQFGTQYYETLQTYLICERSIPTTASALIIHRTTLTYRLGKIQELTRLNLDDANLRLYLMLSFQLLEQGRGLTGR